MLRRVGESRLEITAARPLVLLAVGWMVMLLGVSALLQLQHRMPTVGYVVVLGVAALFFTGGVALALGRRGIVIDRDARTLTKWWGPGRPLWRRAYGLEPITRITVGWVRGADDRDRGDFFPVVLRGEECEPIVVAMPHEADESRALAAAVGELLRIPVQDHSAQPIEA